MWILFSIVAQHPPNSQVTRVQSVLLNCLNTTCYGITLKGITLSVLQCY